MPHGDSNFTPAVKNKVAATLTPRRPKLTTRMYKSASVDRRQNSRTLFSSFIADALPIASYKAIHLPPQFIQTPRMGSLNPSNYCPHSPGLHNPRISPRCASPSLLSSGGDVCHLRNVDSSSWGGPPLHICGSEAVFSSFSGRFYSSPPHGLGCDPQAAGSAITINSCPFMDAVGNGVDYQSSAFQQFKQISSIAAWFREP